MNLYYYYYYYYYYIYSPIEEIWHHCNCNLATYMMSSCTCFKYLVFWQQLTATDDFIPRVEWRKNAQIQWKRIIEIKCQFKSSCLSFSQLKIWRVRLWISIKNQIDTCCMAYAELLAVLFVRIAGILTKSRNMRLQGELFVF